MSEHTAQQWVCPSQLTVFFLLLHEQRLHWRLACQRQLLLSGYLQRLWLRRLVVKLQTEAACHDPVRKQKADYSFRRSRRFTASPDSFDADTRFFCLGSLENVQITFQSSHLNKWRSDGKTNISRLSVSQYVGFSKATKSPGETLCKVIVYFVSSLISRQVCVRR